MEHVVSRADLAGSESPRSPTPESEVLEKFKDLGGLDFVTQIKDAGHTGAIQDDDEDGLEFQLFAAPKAGGDSKAQGTGETHKIQLRSPSLDPSSIGFLKPHRSQSYYFANSPTAEEKNELESAALTGTQVLAHSKSPWPGSAYSWKVLHLPPSGLSKALQPLPQGTTFSRLTGDEQPKKRTRPGKKYRIKLRMKFAASQAKRDAKKADAEAKEAAEREKRTRRNREKKVKKKAKEKAAKMEGKGEGEGDEEGVEIGDPGKGGGHAVAVE